MKVYIVSHFTPEESFRIAICNSVLVGAQFAINEAVEMRLAYKVDFNEMVARGWGFKVEEVEVHTSDSLGTEQAQCLTAGVKDFVDMGLVILA